MPADTLQTSRIGADPELSSLEATIDARLARIDRHARLRHRLLDAVTVGIPAAGLVLLLAGLT